LKTRVLGIRKSRKTRRAAEVSTASSWISRLSSGDRMRGVGARFLAASLLAEITWLAMIGRAPLEDVRAARRFVVWLAKAANGWGEGA